MKNLFTAIKALPLKKMDGSLLAAVILVEAADAGVSEANVEVLREAITVASYLHRDDTRANRGSLPRDSYITHPLRNTLRLIRYGVNNIDVLVASVLHDTIEDHPVDIVVDLAGMSVKGFSDQEVRDLAFAWVSGAYGAEVARIVHAVSNPLPVPGVVYSKAEKRVRYASHVGEIVFKGLPVFFVKFADFYDNAGSLHHTSSNKGMTAHLARKYSLVVPVLADAFAYYRDELVDVLGTGGYADMFNHFVAVRERLNELA